MLQFLKSLCCRNRLLAARLIVVFENEKSQPFSALMASSDMCHLDCNRSKPKECKVIGILLALGWALCRSRRSSPLIFQWLMQGTRGGPPERHWGLSPATVHYMHRLLKQAFAQAVRWQLSLRNPAEAVSPPKVKRGVMNTYDVAKRQNF